jgi:hypothetical protein
MSISMKNRSGGADWPSLWPQQHPMSFPALSDRWVPEHTHAAIVCQRILQPSEIVLFDTPDEAAEAMATLYDGPCDPLCEGQHVLVATVPGRLVIHSPRPAPENLAQQLESAGYRAPTHDNLPTTPRLWPTPSQWNPQLTNRGAPMTPQTQHAVDAAIVEQSGPKQLQPHPRGLLGRISDAISDGDEQLASALTDALLACLPPEDTGTHTAAI